ncbi:L,D-transpeptidase [Candidatus Woesearchaeota archaeon]|nr:L,D-transpeptidase [Candidatus Woesearchaeota archaeon]
MDRRDFLRSIGLVAAAYGLDHILRSPRSFADEPASVSQDLAQLVEANAKQLFSEDPFEMLNQQFCIGDGPAAKTKIPDNNPLDLDKRYQYSSDDLSRYGGWVRQTVEESKRNKNIAFLIDKAAYTLYVIKNGFVHASHTIELGNNPFDDKQIAKDKTTPEGLYKIVKKIPHSTFYKMLLIDYPNDHDLLEFENFRKEVRENTMLQEELRAKIRAKKFNPDKISIGGDIGIHGYGSGKAGNGEGCNWTAGCIALTDTDMDTIYDYAKVGTRVTIVKYGADIALKDSSRLAGSLQK